MSNVTVKAMSWTEAGLVPDAVIRAGIRRLIRDRLAQVRAADCTGMAEDQARFIRAMDVAPQVLECHNIAGNYEYLLRVEVGDLAEYKEFHAQTLGQLLDERVKVDIFFQVKIILAIIGIEGDELTTDGF